MNDELSPLLRQILFCKNKLRRKNRKKRVLDANGYRQQIAEMRTKIIAARQLQGAGTTLRK